MKILAIGDVFGHAGRDIVYHELSGLKKELNADFMIVNFENASGGNGVSEANARELLAVSSVDVYTSGNHIWDKKDILKVIGNERILRPANYPGDCPGRGYGIYETPNGVVGVINLSGTVFMENLNNPFILFDTIYEILHPRCDIICVDFHAEATSEKIAFGYHADGRAGAVFGPHTHVQPADERVLEKGCGFITDIGMTGPLEGVIGVEKDIIVRLFLTQRKSRFETASGACQLNGALFDFDRNGRCVKVERVRRIFD